MIFSPDSDVLVLAVANHHLLLRNTSVSMVKESQASTAQHEFLDPLQNEFCKYVNGDLVPHTTDYLPAPKAIIEMVNCDCKGNCSSQRCGCRSHNLACTERCLCSTKCQNDDDYNCNPLSDESTDYIMIYGRYDLKLLKKCLLHM